jgi:hypothetical protein
MHTISIHRSAASGADHVSVGVVLEGLGALIVLVAFIGALCGFVTWALVQAVTAAIS